MPDQSSSEPYSANESTEQIDRPSLLEKARAFLMSPGVRDEKEAAKRRFLEEKGLTSEEIDSLVRELPPQAPPIPPRTYPPPPPSNLPVLLATLFKALTWLAGASGTLLFGYYRFLLPRLIRSLDARHKLKLHQFELLGRLRGRINELQTIQMQAYDALSLPEELPTDIKSFTDLPVNSVGEPTHTLGVVVRCAFLGETAPKLTLEDLYQRLLGHFPGLKAAHESEYKHFILRELLRSGSFEKTTEDGLEYWSLRQDVNSGPPSKLTRSIPSSQEALENLRDTTSRGHRKINAYQHAFKSLTDLTAYLSRESFAMYSANSGFRYGLPGTQFLGPAEEDVRREIRALKGLVLNRRTFAPSPHRPSLTPSTSSTAVAG